MNEKVRLEMMDTTRLSDMNFVADFSTIRFLIHRIFLVLYGSQFYLKKNKMNRYFKIIFRLLVRIDLYSNIRLAFSHLSS